MSVTNLYIMKAEHRFEESEVIYVGVSAELAIRAMKQRWPQGAHHDYVYVLDHYKIEGLMVDFFHRRWHRVDLVSGEWEEAESWTPEIAPWTRGPSFDIDGMESGNAAASL